MALCIRDPETDRLARELAAVTGETMTQAIKIAVRERLERSRARRRHDIDDRRQKAIEIIEQFRKLPVLDDRSADEIIGYDEHGLPT